MASTSLVNYLHIIQSSCVAAYATSAQVENQQTVRTVAVDGLTPQAANYPYQRTLYYAYKQPASPQVQAFLGYIGSSQGQQTLSTANK